MVNMNHAGWRLCLLNIWVLWDIEPIYYIGFLVSHKKLPHEFFFFWYQTLNTDKDKSYIDRVLAEFIVMAFAVQE